jgi:hypothetical protein
VLHFGSVFQSPAPIEPRVRQGFADGWNSGEVDLRRSSPTLLLITGKLSSAEAFVVGQRA